MYVYKRYILAVVGIILSIVMCGCGKSVKLWQCQGSTDEEQEEVRKTNKIVLLVFKS